MVCPPAAGALFFLAVRTNTDRQEFEEAEYCMAEGEVR